MEILLLSIYSVFVWLLFFKLRWLPWNIVSQVIVITLPILGLTVLILLLNIVAPSSHDVRVVNYVVAVNPRISGLVTEVPIEPNRPLRKGDLLFRLDPRPYEIEIQATEASRRALQAQLKGTAAKKAALRAKLDLVRTRVRQFQELTASGAGNKFDFESAQSDELNLQGEMDVLSATEDQVAAQIAEADAKLADGRWKLEQTEYRAPANGTVVSLALRPGAMAVQFPMTPAMTFVEDEQWIMAIFSQNEVRKVKPGQEAEIAFKMYPGRIVKCKVDSIMWATASGQMPIGGVNPSSGIAPIPANSLAVRLVTDGRDRELFLASGARGQGAVFTDSGHMIQILRKVLVRISAKIDWLILKLH
jgi:multidrug resistance efflux pump